jgi:hypothetical protein
MVPHMSLFAFPFLRISTLLLSEVRVEDQETNLIQNGSPLVFAKDLCKPLNSSPLDFKMMVILKFTPMFI